jgi:sugar/nucleoside kinase (ribokinase family)
MFDIITIGGATRDITFLTDKGKVIETPENLTEQRLLGFEYGAKIRSEDVHMNFGSGACNAAASFAKMGLNVAICARVGNDEDGESILKNLRTRGISTDLLQKDENRNTGFSFVVINADGNGERVIFVHKGASNNLAIHKEEIKNTKWIYLAALCGDWENSLEQISETIMSGIVQKDRIRLAWNPGETEIEAGKKKLAKMLEVTDVLIVNKDEAIELVESDGEAKVNKEEFNDTNKLVEVMKGWGPEMVVITDGKNGAYFSTGEGVFKAPAFIGKQVDTTGAGDAFGAGLVAGYILTSDLEKALKFGILNSAGTVSEYGAQNGIMTREEVENNLQTIKVERIK